MFDKQIKKLKLLDLALMKISVVAFVLFAITIWPAMMNWINSVNPWYFLIISLVAAAIAQVRIWKK
ncbi:MAG: hypothetical protein KJ697_01775 [Nanoarchaeota archaeon]|nr:hypothetical protein [Nanoarchaeota archaeon]MBU4124580.1 hypothetical protein [Nanoarchaeota archaeon]